MKTKLSFIAIAAAALLWGACASTGPRSGAAVEDERVQVHFENPASFTDVKSSHMEDVANYYLTDLQRHIVRRARSYLAPDQTLAVTFIDLDMAGEFEPWRVRAPDVRVIKAIYPPRAEFTWTVTDGDGNIVRQGRERLVDLNFTMRSGFNLTADPLYYEKQMLDEWMQRALR